MLTVYIIRSSDLPHVIRYAIISENFFAFLQWLMIYDETEYS